MEPTKLENDSAKEFDWAGYYERKMADRFGNSNEGYNNWRLLENEPLLNTIKKYVKPGDTVLETGVGFGTLSIELTKEGYKCAGMDLSNAVNQSVARNAQALGVKANIVDKTHSPGTGMLTLFQGDMLKAGDIPQTNVIFSQGILEHYSPDERIQMIKNLMDKADTVIISVPTAAQSDPHVREVFGLTVNKAVDGKDVGNIGDEKFDNPKVYESLIEQAGGELIQKGGYAVMPDIRDGKFAEPNLGPGIEVFSRVADKDGFINFDNVFSLTVLHPRPVDTTKRDDPEELARCYEAAYDRSLFAFWVIRKKQ
ncbi:MAG TPA: class I SAM-dependent methyltransferase [Candidatus Saccharimonadales bacterium]|nr:class I SAM-dependent methyltransferase [Candidatus Saccharimonadales bacterium]